MRTIDTVTDSHFALHTLTVVVLTILAIICFIFVCRLDALEQHVAEHREPIIEIGAGARVRLAGVNEAGIIWGATHYETPWGVYEHGARPGDVYLYTRRVER